MLPNRKYLLCKVTVCSIPPVKYYLLQKTNNSSSHSYWYGVQFVVLQLIEQDWSIQLLAMVQHIILPVNQ